MCNQCHRALSDQAVDDSLTRSLENPKFEIWNSASVNYIRLAALGVNGPVIQEKAEKLFVDFIKYKTVAGNCDTNLQTTLDEIRSFKQYCQDKNLSRDEIKNIVYDNNIPIWCIWCMIILLTGMTYVLLNHI